jgi:hypothetical protein
MGGAKVADVEKLPKFFKKMLDKPKKNVIISSV